MMQVRPVPLNVRWVFSKNDLKPTNSTLRSLSKVSPLFGSHARLLNFHARRPFGTRPPIRVRLPRERGDCDKICGGSLSSGPAAWRVDRRLRAEHSTASGSCKAALDRSLLRGVSLGFISVPGALPSPLPSARMPRPRSRRSYAARGSRSRQSKKQGVHGHKRSVPGQQWAKSYFKIP